MKKALPAFLDRADALLCEGELGRLTVVDAEIATVAGLTVLSNRGVPGEKWYVTVLMGALETHTEREASGVWADFRENDQVRPVTLRLQGKGATKGGLVLQGVEMVRKGSRNPTRTTFATNAPLSVLSPADVALAYLSRWPNQESVFRNTRNGSGLNRSHGYGGTYVQNVALVTAMEQAERSVACSERRPARAREAKQAMGAAGARAPGASRRRGVFRQRSVEG